MESPPTPSSRTRIRPRAAAAWAAALLALGLVGCVAPGARATGPVVADGADLYEPPEAPPYAPQASAPAPEPAPRAAAPAPATPPPAERPRPAPTPAPVATRTPAPVPAPTGSTTDPGSRYLPLGEPVGGLPVETPPLGYR